MELWVDADVTTVTNRRRSRSTQEVVSQTHHESTQRAQTSTNAAKVPKTNAPGSTFVWVILRWVQSKVNTQNHMLAPPVGRHTNCSQSVPAV